MKKFFGVIFSFVCAICLCFGITLNVNTTKYVSAESVSIGTFSLAMDTKGDYNLGACTNNVAYIVVEDGASVPYDGGWSVRYTSQTGVAKRNGENISLTLIKLAEESACLEGLGATKAGDIVTIDGDFSDGNNTFTVEEVTFVYDGNTWATTNDVAYDINTSVNAGSTSGFYFTAAENSVPVSADWSSHVVSYATGATNTNNGILYNGVRLNCSITKFTAVDWYVQLGGAGKSAVSGDVVTVGGWFYGTSGGVLYPILFKPTTFKYDGTNWTQYIPSITVSLDGTEIEGDSIAVLPGAEANFTATADNGGEVSVTYDYYKAVQDGKFAICNGQNPSNYVATFGVSDGYRTYTKQLNVTVAIDDFVMEEGAAVRVAEDEVNGLRFSAEMSENTYNTFKNGNATFGMVIVPKDYITDGYELTASNLFGENAKYSVTAQSGASQAVRKMIHLDNLTPSDRDGDGKYELYGTITDIRVNNLTREFVSVAYVCMNGEYIMAPYYGNLMENNARSMYYVAQRAITANDNADTLNTKYITAFQNYLTEKGGSYPIKYTVNYIKTTGGKTVTESVEMTGPLNSTGTLTPDRSYDGYKIVSASSIDYKLYANKENVFDFYFQQVSVPSYDNMAWFYPNEAYAEDPDATVQKMKDAGFTCVNLGFDADITDASDSEVAAIKEVINKFWEHGLTSVVYIWNYGSTETYEGTYLPDFSDCEGFAGLQIWDEPAPTTAAMNSLAKYVEWYNTTYGEKANIQDMPFMVALYPSSGSSWSSGNYTNYADYIQAYIDIVLANVEGTKYLSMDSYPIKEDGTLGETFLYDLAILKAKAVANSTEGEEIFTNAILQACGFEGQGVAPTEEEFRLQLYTALAFGMDSVSWWGYARPDSTIYEDQTASGNATVYSAMQTVNNELASFGALYKTFDWQGVIMSSPSKGFIGIGKDAQYVAFNKVKSDSFFASYLMSESETASFSSISGSGSNYIIGVMEDDAGNEAFTIVNYAALDDNKTLTLTLKARTEGQYTIYTANGPKTVTIPTGGYTLTLEPGAGAFITSAASNYTVIFQDEDGTVLQESVYTYGTTPVYTGATPEKAGKQFVGWTPGIVGVTCDVVYTAVYKDLYTAQFINVDGTATPYAEYTQQTATTVTQPETPTLDGYTFVGWYLDGVEYDFTTQVTDDITLVAKWNALSDAEKGEKTTIVSAEEVSAAIEASRDPYVTANEGVVEGQGWASWAYDSDYHCALPSGQSDANPAHLLTRGVNLTSNTTGNTSITMPKVNYTLYSKVDFACIAEGSAITGGSINGTTFTRPDQWLFSIVTDSTGTKLIVYTMNAQVANPTTIVLPEVVANGEEGLTLTLTLNGWSRYYITEFHGTSRMLDYEAKMAEAVTSVEDAADDAARLTALQSYDKYAAYRTEYEVSLGDPDAITSAREAIYYNAIISAENGSQAQYEAIADYRAYSESLTDAQRENATHVANVAAINDIIETYFANVEKTTVANAPTVSGATYTGDQVGTTNCHTNHKSPAYAHYYMAQFSSAPYDGTFTLNAFSFNAYDEVSFGLYAVSGGNGTITIGSASTSFDNTKNHYYKIVIVDGVLTAYDDSLDNADGGGVVFTTTLAEDVANGVTGLVITFTFDAWSQAEITEMSTKKQIGVVYAFENAPTVSGATYTGDQVGTTNCHTNHKSPAYAHYYMAQFSSAPNDGTFTLNAFSFNDYTEVSFGLFAITGGNGTITIGDGSTSFDASKAHYYKVVVRNGVLTAYDDSNDNADGGVVFTATLDANVLNGTAGLVIDFQFDAWSQAEITEINATKAGDKVFTVSNQATIAGDTTAQKYAPASNGGYNGAYQTVEWTYANLAQTGGGTITFTLPTNNFNAYAESYFGLCFAATGTYGTITINGQSYSCPSNLIGHWLSMKVVIKDGTLSIVDDCGKGLGVVFTVALSEGVLNGTEALVITYATDAWSQMEITEVSLGANTNAIA